jgi:hypothetical protein
MGHGGIPFKSKDQQSTEPLRRRWHSAKVVPFTPCGNVDQKNRPLSIAHLVQVRSAGSATVARNWRPCRARRPLSAEQFVWPTDTAFTNDMAAMTSLSSWPERDSSRQITIFQSVPPQSWIFHLSSSALANAVRANQSWPVLPQQNLSRHAAILHAETMPLKCPHLCTGRLAGD